MTEKMLKRIADHYGLDHQLLKLAEECSELSAAACRFSADRSEDKLDNLLEEAADVLVMLAQISHLLDCETHLQLVAEQKILRQVKRMEAENDES